MQGCVASSLIHAYRFFRGSEVVSNKLGHISVERHAKGGIGFFFQIDHKKNELLFTAAITSDSKRFDKKHVRQSCHKQARTDSAKTFTIPYTEGVSLLDQVFTSLIQAESTGELQEKPYLRKLLEKLRLYDKQNAESAELYQDLLDQGVIVLVAA